MNDMNLLSEFRAEVPCTENSPRAEDRILSAIQSPQVTGGSRLGARPLHWPGSSRRGRLAVLAPLAAAVAAAAVTLTLLPGGGTNSPKPLTAQLLADKAADAALARPAVHTGQWVYREYEWKMTLPGLGPQTGTEPGWTPARGGPGVFLAQSHATRSGKPTPARRPPLTTFFGTTSGSLAVGMEYLQNVIPYSKLGTLPSDPAALENYLAHAGLNAPSPNTWDLAQSAFSQIQTMLCEYVLPPKLAAELFRALAYIPGISVRSDTTDITGRHGTAFVLTTPRGTGLAPSPKDQVTQEMILNPADYTLIAVQGSNTGSGGQVSITQVAILRQAYVSGIGVQP
jgi:hypothetical protein